MEYIEDVSQFENKAHASCTAYAMAAPLAADMALHLSQARFGWIKPLHHPVFHDFELYPLIVMHAGIEVYRIAHAPVGHWL